MSDPGSPEGAPAYPPSGFGPSPSTSPPSDVLAWIAIATGGLSWLMCCCAPVPLLGMISGLAGLVLALASVIVGAFAYRDAKRDGGRTELAVIGIGLGGSRLVITLGLVGLAIVLVALGMGAGILSAFTG